VNEVPISSGLFVLGEMMLVTINGKESDILPDSTIQDLIRAKNLPENIVIVDLNGSIINPEDWSNTYLRPDDDLELIQIIAVG
jgi:thiamine biosynthesis protein ThiS